MRALVTGATGYIGHRLCQALADQGWTIHALVRPASDLERIGAVVPEGSRHPYDGGYGEVARSVSAAKPEVVFHLAAMATQIHAPEQVEPMIHANVALGAQILEAMSHGSCRALINAGTYSSFNTAGGYLPDSLYAATKRAFESIIDFYCRIRSIEVTTLVLFDVYGPGDWRPKLLPLLIESALTGRAVETTAGEQALDFVYIDDVVAGLMRAAEQSLNAPPDSGGGVGRHRCFKLDSGRRSTLRQLSQAIGVVAKRPPNVVWGVLPYRPLQIFHPVDAGERLPGWSCEVSLEEGLQRVIEKDFPGVEGRPVPQAQS